MSIDLRLFLPQVRVTPDVLAARAQAAEAAGFGGIALMDHLTPPMAADHPMYEAIVSAAWVAARTERLGIGHLVLCDAFRHPAVLARQAVTLDHASGGRFELGIGWGSVPDEFEVFGVGDRTPRARVDRLAETLEVITRLWSGEAVDFDGAHHHIHSGRQLPVPLGRIPIVIGGIGKRTMELVAQYADWWNVPVPSLARLDDVRPAAGSARVSIQEVVTYVPPGGDREAMVALARRRFGWLGDEGHVFGSGVELVDHFGALHARGVERGYLWFTDFATPDTLAAFGAEVIAALKRG